MLGSHDTYTTLSGLTFPIASRSLISQPFLGGSTTITSALIPLSISSGITSSDLPTKNSALSTLLFLAFSLALIIAGSIISTP